MVPSWSPKGAPPCPGRGGDRTRRCRTAERLFLLGFALLLVVTRDEWAPGLRLDWPGRLPDDVELAVRLHFPDEHGLVQVMIFLVHLRGDAGGRLEGLAGHCGNDLVDVSGLCLLGGLLPHVDADVGR